MKESFFRNSSCKKISGEAKVGERDKSSMQEYVGGVSNTIIEVSSPVATKRE